jgi:hypothetical protein
LRKVNTPLVQEIRSLINILLASSGGAKGKVRKLSDPKGKLNRRGKEIETVYSLLIM